MKKGFLALKRRRGSMKKGFLALKRRAEAWNSGFNFYMTIMLTGQQQYINKYPVPNNHPASPNTGLAA